jgi:hypothetical protein
MATSKIPTGLYVFTVDGEEVGRIRAVNGSSIELDRTAGTGTLVLPAGIVGAVTAGKVELNIDSALLAHRYGPVAAMPAEPPDETDVTEHVPRSAIDAALRVASSRSWAGLHAAAHQLEDDGTDVPMNELSDLIRAVEELQSANEPFPARPDDLYTRVNLVAETIPHETTAS